MLGTMEAGSALATVLITTFQDVSARVRLLTTWKCHNISSQRRRSSWSVKWVRLRIIWIILGFIWSICWVGCDLGRRGRSLLLIVDISTWNNNVQVLESQFLGGTCFTLILTYEWGASSLSIHVRNYPDLQINVNSFLAVEGSSAVLERFEPDALGTHVLVCSAVCRVTLFSQSVEDRIHGIIRVHVQGEKW